MYRGADKSLARPGRKQATATEDFKFHKVGTTSPTGGGRSVGIVRSRTKATEFSLV